MDAYEKDAAGIGVGCHGEDRGGDRWVGSRLTIILVHA